MCVCVCVFNTTHTQTVKIRLCVPQVHQCTSHSQVPRHQAGVPGSAAHGPGPAGPDQRQTQHLEESLHFPGGRASAAAGLACEFQADSLRTQALRVRVELVNKDFMCEG